MIINILTLIGMFLTIYTCTFVLAAYKKELKAKDKLVDRLWAENKELREALLNKITAITPTDFVKATQTSQEATITKEPDDTPDDIYNKTLQEWIYGKTEEEGGIDG